MPCGSGFQTSSASTGNTLRRAPDTPFRSKNGRRPGARGATITFVAVHRNFVKFTFLKVDPAWRRLPAAERERHKREFAAACDNFAADRFLRAFSLVGTRGDTDLLLWCSAPGLADIHEFHVVLGQSGLMAWADTPYSYLAMTKESEYSEEDRLEVRAAQAQVPVRLSVRKKREWYRLPGPGAHADHARAHRDRPALPADQHQHDLLVRPRRPGVRGLVRDATSPATSSTSCRSCGGSESSSYTLRDTPIFTCIASSVRHALDALDGRGADRRPRARAGNGLAGAVDPR